MKRVLIIAALLLVGAAPFAHPSYPLANYVGSALPEFALRGLDGSVIHSESIRGKWTVLAFFATWCGPCNREMPRLRADASRFGLRVVAIDERDPRGAINTFVTRYDLPFTMAIDPPDLTRSPRDWRSIVYGAHGYFGDAEEAFMANVLPGDVLVDPQGIVRAEWSSYFVHDDLAAFMLRERRANHPRG